MSHTMTNGIPEGFVADNGMHVLRSIVDKTFAAFAAYDQLVVELFAGPGGMSCGIEMAGINPRQVLGIEWDASACMTAVKAGHPRLHADITTLDPKVFGKVWGLHGSPSCQGFSMAGKQESRGDTDLLLQAITAMGERPEDADEILATFRQYAKSPLSSLSLEPLRYIIALRPEWVTLEQVRAVLPLWEAYAVVLRMFGYNVWTGLVHSEQFGVPQTRQRAILLGSLVHDVSGGMIPTHSRFHTHKSKRGQLDPGVLPYVTMAQALGWGEREFTVRSNYGTGGVAENRGERHHDEPSATITSKAGRNKVLDGARVLNSDPKPQERTGDEPSFTVTATGRHPGFEFMGDVRTSHGCIRSVDEPAPTLTSSMDNGNFQWVGPTAANEGTTEADMEWVYDRPSPTIVGSFEPSTVAAPGYRKAGDGPRQKAKGSVSVTIQEAGILQSFPADYPWTGSKTKQFEQAGNAVPPLLGQAMIETVIGKRASAQKAA